MKIRARQHRRALPALGRPPVSLAVALVVQALVSSSSAAEHSTGQPSKIDFNREIRPILTENCFKCHGPDAAVRKGELRFDVRAESLKPAKSGLIPIVPGAPERSEMVARITATDPQKHMPPPQTGKKLTPSQIASLQRWISAGAAFAAHWSYTKPVRTELPETKDRGWPRNPVDRFILARLEREGLKPSPEADRLTLIRRVSLDLTGLPPTPAEAEAFAADSSTQAYENLVDRLLMRRTFGEHWARFWLDLARYADSAGYADDPLRTIWGYRDYVIRALNNNKPFDRFTLEQIAGDLLPDATEEEQTATGFHRNTMTNNEGGTDDEEFRNAAIVDRVNTTMAVWMATSMGCAQCHHHKYDPISQEEYFRLFAIFNNTEDADRSDEAPVLQFYTEPQKQQRAKWQSEMQTLDRKLATPSSEIAASQSEWESRFPLNLSWQALLGSCAAGLTETDRTAQYAGTPSNMLEILTLTGSERNEAQTKGLADYYRLVVAPELKVEREHLAQLQYQMADMEVQTVPVMRELEGEKRRKTHVQLRGNFLSKGEEVTEGVPEVFPPLPEGVTPNRLALARWLIDENNPLTARVLANRLWEQIFGIGIVRTSEDFGAQGDLPMHPELLDWLATEMVAQKWDVKAFLRMLVTSAAYRQSSRVTAELQERDPENLLLARGPRFRIPAEEVRDQALFVSGLLSDKMYGPSIRPAQPDNGLTAAFGSSLDWKTSEGEDRYRRALYIEWRRTSPYPSMATFDAPSREVCALRRPRSNTPLQALVTLNDPVYIEAAQGLARRMAKAPGPPGARAEYGFRVCLARPPREGELRKLVSFYEAARQEYSSQPEQAQKLATDPLGPPPEGTDMVELAAWTAVGNILLNLDEMLMKP